MKRYTVLVDSDEELKDELARAIAERFDDDSFVVSDSDGSVNVENLIEKQLFSLPGVDQ